MTPLISLHLSSDYTAEMNIKRGYLSDDAAFKLLIGIFSLCVMIMTIAISFELSKSKRKRTHQDYFLFDDNNLEEKLLW